MLSEHNDSWLDSVTSAVDMLVKTAHEARQKRADLSDMLSSVRDYAGKNPALTSTLGGAAVGGLAGGLSDLGRSKKERNVGRSALTGALSGAAIGGGGYLAATQLPKLLHKLRPNTSDVKLDPKAVAKNPELLKEVDKLRSESLPTKMMGGAYDSVKGYAKNHPLLATIMAGDVASHGLGTAANVVNPQINLNPDTLAAGIKKKLGPEGKGTGLPKPYKETLESIGSQDWKSQARGLALGRVAKAEGTPASFGAAGSLTPDQLYGLTNEGLGGIRPATPRSLLDFASALPDRLGGAWARSKGPLAGTGYGLNKNKHVGSLLRYLNSGTEAGILPRSMRGWGAGALGRVGLYAGLPAAQYAFGQARQDSGNQQRLKELMQQLQGTAK